jgi:hypothetical protein
VKARERERESTDCQRGCVYNACAPGTDRFCKRNRPFSNFQRRHSLRQCAIVLSATFSGDTPESEAKRLTLLHASYLRIFQLKHSHAHLANVVELQYEPVGHLDDFSKFNSASYSSLQGTLKPLASVGSFPIGKSTCDNPWVIIMCSFQWVFLSLPHVIYTEKAL